MTPVAFDCPRDLITRYGNSLSYRKSGQSDKNIIFVVLDTFDLDVGYFIFFGVPEYMITGFDSSVLASCATPGNAKQNRLINVTNMKEIR